MKIKTLIYFVLVPALLLGSCQKEPAPPPGPKPINLDQKSLQLLQTSNDFAFDIFKAIVSNEENDDNLMISPLSISLALAMTYNGADGDTKEAFEKVLHLNGLSVEEINQSYQKLVSALLSVDPKVIMEIANSIWYRDDFSVEDDFLSVNKTYYDAEVSDLDFSNPASVDIINQWVADKTHDKIDKIVDQINPLDVMFLINAIYFKGTWKYEFDENDTHEAPFYDENGNFLKNVQMMMVEGNFNSYSNDLFYAIELPYGQGNYSMIIMLPQAGISIDSLANHMNSDGWKTWMEGFNNLPDVSVFLPKFKFEFKKELKDPLSHLGMEVAFDPYGSADFSKINPTVYLYISSVKHKTFIEVNEEGTEAAAVTSVTITKEVSSIPNKFNANHPFIYVIREKTTGAIMFMGKVGKPEAGS